MKRKQKSRLEVIPVFEDTDASVYELRPSTIGEIDEPNNMEDDFVVYQFNNTNGTSFNERMVKKMKRLEKQDLNKSMSAEIERELREINERFEK